MTLRRCSYSFRTLLALGMLVPAARAQVVISDTLTGTASSYNWQAINGACLTAGTSTVISDTNKIPGCIGLGYYGTKKLVDGKSGYLSLGKPDPNGSGALRLTNGDLLTGSSTGTNQTGAVVSNFTFPSNQGVQVTFTTLTYGGNGYNNGSAASGADGITFFLADGSRPASVGALGGSLGYSCSNGNDSYSGVQGGYIGVGVDEFGNFVNGSVLTQTTTTTTASTSTTTQTYTGSILTDSTGIPTTNPPTWRNGTPTPTTSGPVTSGGQSSSTSSTVTGTAPNAATTTGAATAPTTTTKWTYTPSNPTKHGSGSSATYTIAATYTVTTTTTTPGKSSVSYSMSKGDNTASSAPGAGGGTKQPGRISVRGSGNVNWAWLNATYPTLFPSTLSAGDQKTAVQNTCAAGFPYNNTGNSITVNGSTVSNGAYYPTAVADYPMLASSALPSGSTIYSQEATGNTTATTPTRDNATPITYALSVSQNGLLNLSYSYNGGTAVPVITNQSITASNGPIPSTFRFGFSAGTGGGSNVHEISCFKAAPLNASASSAGVNFQQSARVDVGSQAYLAFYHPVNWWGQLTANNLVVDSATNAVAISPTANWDASCVLTGGACNATGTTVTAQSWTSRNAMTWNDSSGKGVPLTWSNLSSSQQSLLDPAVAGSDSSKRLSFLLGDRSNEIRTDGTGTYRVRNSVLGDITNSSPTWVGAPSLPYSGNWKDLLNPAATMPEGSTSYAAFAANSATRTNVVYIGANDGLLHGFRAGAYNSSGHFDTTVAPNDGYEVLAYMPAAAIGTIHSLNGSPPGVADGTGSNGNVLLDYSSAQYSHNAFVDATPGSGELYYNGAWHTWLVGGLGAGGNGNNQGNASGVIGTNSVTPPPVGFGAIYALDVTDPSVFAQTTAAASSTVIGEWNSNTLTCAGDSGTSVCRNNLGNVTGTPIIRRLHDGNWAVIFGNGFNSSTGQAGIFVMTVDQGTGSRTFRFLPAGSGSGPKTTGSGAATTITARNGIAYVASADLDGDHVTDYVYAGDLFGNVWRFDLTSTTPGNWSVRPTPVFSTGGLPITTVPTITSSQTATGQARVMVDFGTGQMYPQSLTAAATPAAGTQYLFGVWDWDLGSWNGKSTTRYASLSSPQTVNASTLQAQTLTDVAYSSGAISGARTVTSNKVCWAGSNVCASGNTQFGWKVALPDASEQIIYNPTISDGLLLVSTTIPAVNQVLKCDSQPPSGYTLAISTDTGGAPQASYFGNATNNYIATGGAIVAGIGLSGVGTPSFVTSGSKKYLITQNTAGTGAAVQVNPGANAKGRRVNWIKLR